MSLDWPSASFLDLIDKGALEIGDGYRAKNDELGGDGMIFLRAGHVTDTHIDFAGADRFQTLAESKFGRKISGPGDVVITTKGNSTGRVAFVTAEMPKFVYSPHLSYWRSLSPTTIDQGYLRAWSQSAELLEQMAAMSRSTDMAPYLSLSDQRRLRITLPPIATQKNVAALNDSLLARIALLRETNATLEAIAQALFKSWFVDFDPVRAKAQGRAPGGMDEATAALFPDGFEESVLGSIPRTWTVCTIAEMCQTITNGGTPSRANEAYWANGTIPWFKTGELEDGFLISPSERISQAALEGSSAKLLPEQSILMAIYAAPTVGRLGVLTERAAFNQACTGMVARRSIGPWFLFQTLRFGRDWFNSRANGAAQQNISKAIVSSYQAVLPPPDVVSVYHQIAESLFERIRANAEQAVSLAALRDTLLPRLISGQLRLPEAEAQLQPA